MKTISILGCGWLGLPLAVSLINEGYKVKGSTTTKEKREELTKKGIDSSLIQLTPEAVEGDVTNFLEGTALLIINIPPGMRKNPSEPFSKKIENLIPFVEKSSVTEVIFISSTSVYGNGSGIITEETRPEPETAAAKELLLAEQQLSNNPNFKTTIIRFGGLTGPDRHPVVFLSGKKNVKNPYGNINFIHQDDCIGLIEKVIEKNAWGFVFNGVYPDYPTRKDYYMAKAKELSIAPPGFDETTASPERKVRGIFVEKVLEYYFKTSI